jgi:hypothetical protein
MVIWVSDHAWVTTPKTKNPKTAHQAPKLELQLDLIKAIPYTKFEGNLLRNG